MTSMKTTSTRKTKRTTTKTNSLASSVLDPGQIAWIESRAKVSRFSGKSVR